MLLTVVTAHKTKWGICQPTAFGLRSELQDKKVNVKMSRECFRRQRTVDARSTHKEYQHGTPQATVIDPGYQSPSASRIRRVHTRVALARSLVSAAWSMVGPKMYRNTRGSSGGPACRLVQSTKRNRRSLPSAYLHQMVSPERAPRLLI